MAGAKSCAWLVVVWWTVAMHGDGAHVRAPAPSMDCSSALLSLADCLTFVENGSTEAKPQTQCCSALKKVVKEAATACLCDAFKEGATFGVKLNMTRAMGLPSSCGVSTSHFSKCKSAVAASPGAAPGVAMVPSPTAGRSGAAASSTAPVGGLINVAIALFVYYYI
uniref:Bifunctional inhibitor/plant lipid transfer protein/seed storage helical domain-containing protein n=1 Tax=Musa acuminata subsp. malaccensis TaxID=214687 RepID=A0A804L0C0_MUSAM|nr:PREDICTED: non-specific lipid-transfer protein-like protein At5g64080 isoform X2 [Musa acuminata subsp. malaccensis]